MLDDFFTRALLAGIGVGIITGPLGCFIIWRRMAYFGDTVSHSALLGVALAFLLQINTGLAVFAVAAFVALSLTLMQRVQTFSSDAVLGILSHSTLAIGLVIVAFMTWLRIDLMAFLFGDILAVSRSDLVTIYLGGAAALGILALIWRRLIADTACPDLARAEGLRPELTRLVFMLLVAGVVAIAMKVVGILLITALLIIPAASARTFSGNPEAMALLAAGLGALSAICGLYISLYFDTPSGPSIVVAALGIFLIGLAAGNIGRAFMQTRMRHSDER
jgi:zinc transport system permease protein